MEKIKKQNLIVLITNWIRVPLTIGAFVIIAISLHYTGFPVEIALYGGITALIIFNAIWFTARHKKYGFGIGSLLLSIAALIVTCAIVGSGINTFFNFNGRMLVLFILGVLDVVAGIIKLVFEIKLFKHRHEMTPKHAIPETNNQTVSKVKPKKKKKDEMAQINPDNYEEFALDHKSYLYIFGAFFIIFEKKCFGWRYIGKSKEGEISNKGVKVFKYAWFSRAHELKTSKLFKFVEFVSNIFIWLSNLLTTLILLVVGVIILLFVLGVKNAAIGVIIAYFGMIALNVLLALLGKLLFKVQKVRENNPPGFFDYLDSAVDEEREVMEKMRHEKEKKEFVEEVRKASKDEHTSESSESEKLRLIKEYKELLKDGTITKKEFDAKKKKLLE